jgi:hypothetical protein
MFRQIFFWLVVLSLSFPSLESWAMPKSLIMTTVLVSNEGGRNIRANAKIWYSNMQFRTEVDSNVKMSNSSSPVKINNKATVIMDMNKKVGFMLDESHKTALRVDTAQFNQMTGSSGQSTNNAQFFTDPTLLSDPAKLRGELQKQGGKQVGKATLLGHPCSIWVISKSGKIPAGQGKSSTEMVTVKIWLAEDLVLPLKVEISTDKRGEVASLETKSLEVNIPIKASLFAVPGGYKISDLSEMFKTPNRGNRH